MYVLEGVTPFFVNKFEREAARNWDKFYGRNRTNFFRDRHWTTSEKTDGFPCLLSSSSGDVGRDVVVESGCGVANCAFPLLEANQNLEIYMFDFASKAIDLIHSSPSYEKHAGRCSAFVWDFSLESPSLSVSIPEAKFALMVFVLSAVPPGRQLTAVKNLAALLKPGEGKILFRDYATGDMAQKRFAKSSTINPNYFVRQDSTLSYFFDEDKLHSLMTEAGLVKVYVRRIHRTIVNRKDKLEMQRVFLQAEYMKPPSAVDKPKNFAPCDA